MRITIPGVLLAAILFAPAAWADDDKCGGLAAGVTHGEIKWDDKAILAQGTGAPKVVKGKTKEVILRETERAAELDALRKVLELVKGVQVTATATGADRAADNAVSAKVRGAIRGFKRCKSKYYADGGVDVVIMVPLNGPLASALLPEAKPKKPEGKNTFSSIIVIAAGKGLKPALAPRILDDKGAELYTVNMVKSGDLQSNGAVTYVKSLEDAKKHALAGANPLEVAAVSIKDGADIVVSAADGEKFKEAAGALSGGRILVVRE
ncbi:MAG: hypothetical protein GMKNLPBB_01037 [Myxococcota bacterium]|nr:hypothetical protein [Myxococcota bacterium]